MYLLISCSQSHPGSPWRWAIMKKYTSKKDFEGWIRRRGIYSPNFSDRKLPIIPSEYEKLAEIYELCTLQMQQIVCWDPFNVSYDEIVGDVYIESDDGFYIKTKEHHLGSVPSFEMINAAIIIRDKFLAWVASIDD